MLPSSCRIYAIRQASSSFSVNWLKWEQFCWYQNDKQSQGAAKDVPDGEGNNIINNIMITNSYFYEISFPINNVYCCFQLYSSGFLIVVVVCCLFVVVAVVVVWCQPVHLPALLIRFSCCFCCNWRQPVQPSSSTHKLFLVCIVCFCCKLYSSGYSWLKGITWCFKYGE